MGFEILITLDINFNVLWDVKPCFLARIYELFEEFYCLHLPDRRKTRA